MSELNIGKVIIDQTKTSQVVVNYADTSKPDTSTITSNRSQMTATVESIATAFEASKTYYFDENGNPVTTNQGYGTLGTTDSNGVLTVAHSIPTITALTTDPESPEPATNFELSGESTSLVGKELTLQYSTDDSTWLSLGVATVQGDGTWSKADCRIADAGSYYLRAVYDVDVVESASITVTVESGQVIPTTNIYDRWSNDNSTALSGDMFQHRGNADVLIVLQRLGGLWMRYFNTASKTVSTYYTNVSTGGNYLNADSIDANDAHHLSGLNYTEVTRNRYTANNNSAGVSNNADEKVGIINISGVMHVLLSNAKLYSANSDYSVLTEVGTLPVGANTTRKSMAYDSEYNILFVLEGSTVRVINLATLALITSLSVGTQTGICHHKGRLHACNQVADRTTITVYKNSNDA